MAARKAGSAAGLAWALLALLVGGAAPADRAMVPRLEAGDRLVLARPEERSPRPRLGGLARRALLAGHARAPRIPDGSAPSRAPAWLEASEEREFATRAAALPLRPPVEPLLVSSGFGPRTSPFTGRPILHQGLDLAAPRGALVRAAGAGIVRRTGWDGPFGRIVEIAHEGGLVSRYAHLDRILVRAGTRVFAGQPIGRVGSSGRSTGPHLHFEVRLAGTPQDPARWLRAGLLLAAVEGGTARAGILGTVPLDGLTGLGGEPDPAP
ncbi:MAG: M23 family metallopeptidase [Geminicoccaceae bacterium]|nr:M23 family metallopeptidase [Geminicoccaceae bacterium]MDW8123778.1 M23 family metallopeptidase [Geminicoccaceae bacterium]